MREIINKILDTLFPQRCFGCRKNGDLLCGECIAALPRSHDTTIENPRLYALFDYKNRALRKALWALKYRGRTTLAQVFGRILYDELLEELHDKILFENFKEPILVPIPLSWKRLQERGFNQAHLLTQEIFRFDQGRSFAFEARILKKIKETKPQMSLKNRKERLENVVGCFSVKNSEKIRGRNIILIDDIITTGATLREAQKVLKKAGARSVIGFTVAH